MCLDNTDVLQCAYQKLNMHMMASKAFFFSFLFFFLSGSFGLEFNFDFGLFVGFGLFSLFLIDGLNS